MSTIKDVAKEAGVSLMTVSRVINNTGQVKQETIDKVNEAIIKLGYRPNLLAKSLAKGESKTIGIISSNMYNQVYIDIITSIEKTAYKEGFVVINVDVSNSIDAKQAFNMLLGSKVDGIIILPLEMDMSSVSNLKLAAVETEKFFNYFNEVRISEDLKAVTISQKMDGVPNIEFDFKGQAIMTMDYLFEKGYEDISFINANYKDGLWQEREDVYLQKMNEKNLSKFINIEYCDMSIADGKKAMEVILNKRVPKAVYCANDFLALGALQAILERGYKIPKDIAVIGNDDIPACEFVYPRLTSIGLGAKKVGIYAINSLFSLLQNESVEDSKAIPYLVERQTT